MVGGGTESPKLAIIRNLFGGGTLGKFGI